MKKYDYRTFFEISPALQSMIKTAQEYLARDNMVKYFIHEDSNGLEDKIESITWYLSKDGHIGYVQCISTEPLNEDELDIISQFVSSQNSSGIGLSFEFEFGSVFDWKENDYQFSEILPDEQIAETCLPIANYCLFTSCEDNPDNCIFHRKWKEKFPNAPKRQCPPLNIILDYYQMMTK